MEYLDWRKFQMPISSNSSSSKSSSSSNSALQRNEEHQVLFT